MSVGAGSRSSVTLPAATSGASASWIERHSFSNSRRGERSVGSRGRTARPAADRPAAMAGLRLAPCSARGRLARQGQKPAQRRGVDELPGQRGLFPGTSARRRRMRRPRRRASAGAEVAAQACLDSPGKRAASAVPTLTVACSRSVAAQPGQRQPGSLATAAEIVTAAVVSPGRRFGHARLVAAFAAIDEKIKVRIPGDIDTGALCEWAK